MDDIPPLSLDEWRKLMDRHRSEPICWRVLITSSGEARDGTLRGWVVVDKTRIDDGGPYVVLKGWENAPLLPPDGTNLGVLHLLLQTESLSLRGGWLLLRGEQTPALLRGDHDEPIDSSAVPGWATPGRTMWLAGARYVDHG